MAVVYENIDFTRLLDFMAMNFAKEDLLRMAGRKP